MTILGALLGLVILGSGFLFLVGAVKTAVAWLRIVLIVALGAAAVSAVVSSVWELLSRARGVLVVVGGGVVVVLVLIAKLRVDARLASIRKAFSNPGTSAKARHERGEF